MSRDYHLPLEEAYFRWLGLRIGAQESLDKNSTYWTLLAMLHHKEFYWLPSVPRDANRASDGKALRFTFLEETGRHTEGDFRQFDCSVLELLSVLAWDVSWDAAHGDMKYWFWVLIDNLGLTGCTDAHPPDEETLDLVLENLMQRKYGPNGHGGLFPLNDTAKDQREVELFYQAQAYLLEREPI